MTDSTFRLTIINGIYYLVNWERDCGLGLNPRIDMPLPNCVCISVTIKK